jgi:hypothetical protein
VNIELYCRGTFMVRTSATAKAIGDPSFFKNPALLGLVADVLTMTKLNLSGLHVLGV